MSADKTTQRDKAFRMAGEAATQQLVRLKEIAMKRAQTDERATQAFTCSTCNARIVLASQVAKKMEAAEAVAYHAEEFLSQLEKRWPEVNDMDEWRYPLLQSISDLRLLP